MLVTLQLQLASHTRVLPHLAGVRVPPPGAEHPAVEDVVLVLGLPLALLCGEQVHAGCLQFGRKVPVLGLQAPSCHLAWAKGGNFYLITDPCQLRVQARYVYLPLTRVTCRPC